MSLFCFVLYIFFLCRVFLISFAAVVWFKENSKICDLGDGLLFRLNLNFKSPGSIFSLSLSALFINRRNPIQSMLLNLSY